MDVVIVYDKKSVGHRRNSILSIDRGGVASSPRFSIEQRRLPRTALHYRAVLFMRETYKNIMNMLSQMQLFVRCAGLRPFLRNRRLTMRHWRFAVLMIAVHLAISLFT